MGDWHSPIGYDMSGSLIDAYQVGAKATMREQNATRIETLPHVNDPLLAQVFENYPLPALLVYGGKIRAANAAARTRFGWHEPLDMPVENWLPEARNIGNAEVMRVKTATGEWIEATVVSTPVILGDEAFQYLWLQPTAQLPPTVTAEYKQVLLTLAKSSDATPEAAFERILSTAARTVGVERVGLWFFTPDRQAIVEHALYQLSKQTFSHPNTRLECKDYPNYFRALEKWRVIDAPDVRNDLRTCEFNENYLIPLGITSMLDVPIWLEGKVIGIVCTEHVGPLRPWTLPDESFMRGIADMIGAVIEADERRKAELAAQQRAAELQAVLDQMLDVVIAVDRTGQPTFVNRAGRQTLGLRDDEPLPLFERLTDAFEFMNRDGTTIPPHEHPLLRALQGTILYDQEILSRNKQTGHVRTCRVSAAPIVGPNRTIEGAVSVSRDITPLSDLDRLKDQFLRVTTHELRTPIAVALGYAQFLQRQIESGKAVSEATVRSLLRGIERINRLSDDLVEALRVQANIRSLSIEMAPVDLHALVLETARDAAVTTTNHRFDVAGEQGLVVQGDRLRLRQVLANLLSNAIKFSPARGTITVRLQREHESALVIVADQGVGIPQEKQDRLFQLFYRAHTDTAYDVGGMGIGLYLARQIVEQHGGTIGVTSQEGKGSSFWIRLPLGNRVAEGS